MSHTALMRWIKAGDLPTVYTERGRMELPVASLIDLYEAVSNERSSGRRSRHLLEPTMSEGQARARQLDTHGLSSGDGGRSHRRADLRSLAYHRALAPRLRRPMVDDALHTLWKWRDQGKIDPRYAKQWEEVLRQPVSEIRRTISVDSEFARDLRQNSPFAGMLTEAERRKIIQQVR